MTQGWIFVVEAVADAEHKKVWGVEILQAVAYVYE